MACNGTSQLLTSWDDPPGTAESYTSFQDFCCKVKTQQASVVSLPPLCLTPHRWLDILGNTSCYVQTPRFNLRNGTVLSFAPQTNSKQLGKT